jgi:hypothetical protein
MLVAGREAGLAPQDPITQKTIDIVGWGSDASYTLPQRERAVLSGVTMAQPEDNGTWAIMSGWNTLQPPNDQVLINSDPQGTSAMMVILRIDGALDKLIRAWGKPLGLGGGRNLGQLSEAVVLSAWKSFWDSQLPTGQNTNTLIITYIPSSLSVVLEDGVRWRLTAEYKPNSEITQTFVTYNKVL